MKRQYLLLVEQRLILYDNSKRHRSYTIQVQGSSNILHSPHISASVFLTLKTLSINGNRDLTLRPQCHEKNDFARVMASSRHLSRFGEGLIVSIIHSGAQESKISNTCAQHIEDCKVGAEDSIAQNFELGTVLTLVNYQNHQTAGFMPHPAKLNQMTSIMEPSWIETINVPACPR